MRCLAGFCMTALALLTSRQMGLDLLSAEGAIASMREAGHVNSKIFSYATRAARHSSHVRLSTALPSHARAA